MRRFVDDVAFGAGAWDGLYDERARATALANADTWLDQYHDPGRLAIDISPLAEAPFSITVCLGTTNRSALPEIARRVAGSLPSATLVEVQGAGHGAPSSHPAELAEVVMACVAGDQA